jgi:thiosulfate/3-mercaptopyruvate sulfurtransferase
MHEHFLSVEDLRQLQVGNEVVIIDCRYSLDDPGWGKKAWEKGHLPGAFYADLGDDLSDMSKSGLGRHPLPDLDRFCNALGRWGVNTDKQVVVYDDTSGAMASRLWWLLRHIGIKSTAVLDGGIQAWVYAGLPLDDKPPENSNGRFVGQFGSMPVVSTAQIDSDEREQLLLIDARAGDRFRGEAEPIDSVAGHVEGAVNRPYYVNLDANGCIRKTNDLQRGWRWVVGDWEPSSVVHMCGSGVTACLSLLAMEHAGLRGSVLYPESWSGWIEDPNRPVASLVE